MGIVKYTGPMASFHCPTNAEIRSLKVHFSPKQEGSGDPSPENVRPIVGWDGAKAYKSGKNLFDINGDTSLIYDNVAIQNNKIVISSIGNGATSRVYFSTLYEPGTYTFSGKFSGDIEYIRVFSPKPFTGSTYNAYYGGYFKVLSNGSATITMTEQFTIGVIAAGVARSQGTMYDLQLELGSTATHYEPYQGETTNYTFGVLGKNKFNPQFNWTIGDTYRYIYLPELEHECIISFTRKDSSINVSDISVGFSYLEPSKVAEINKGYRWCLSGGIIKSYIKTNTVFEPQNSEYLNQLCRYLVIYPKTQDVYDRLTSAFDIQIEFGSTATTYEPYDPNHTVYGGWVDLITGEVQQEWSNPITYDGVINKGISVIKNADMDRFGVSLGYVVPNSNPEQKRWTRNWAVICDKIPIKSNVASSEPPYINPSPTGNLYNHFYLDKISDRQELSTDEEILDYVNQWLQENPVTLTYFLSKPNTYHLAPTSMQTFLSHNNVWSNADYIEVEYDLHETQSILARKQFIMANQPHIVTPAAAPLQNFVTDVSAPLKECKVHFSPVQDLHGYDKPWVGGSGKNLFNANDWWQDDGGITVINENKITCGTVSYVENKNRYTLPSQSMYVLSFHVKTLTNTSGLAYVNISTYTEEDSIIDRSRITLGDVGNEQDISLSIPDTAYYFKFTNWAYSGTVELSNIQLEAGSTATSYEPYENICPIEGWNGVENLNDPKYGGYIFWNQLIPPLDIISSSKWSGQNADLTITNGVAHIVSKSTYGRLTLNASNLEVVSGHKHLIICDCKPNTVRTTNLGYAINCNIGGTAIPVPLIAEQNVWHRYWNIFTTKQTASNYVYFGDPNAYYESGDEFDLKNIQLFDLTAIFGEGNEPNNYSEFASVFPADYYEKNLGEKTCVSSINGNQYSRLTIDWTTEAGTVYGGYVDLIKGEVVAKDVMFTVDATTPIASTTLRSNGVFRITYDLPAIGADKNALASNLFALRERSSAANNYPQSGKISLDPYNTLTDELIVGAYAGVTTQTEWLAWLESNGPVQVLYELATPVTYPIDPITLKILRGTNNIWSNANGNIELKYWTH